MRKTVLAAADEMSDELRPEYEFDFSKSKPNRFAGNVSLPAVVISLDPDVAEVFRTPESVNAVLRALIQTMPGGQRSEEPGVGSE